MKEKYELKGMTCANCESTVKTALSSVDGFNNVKLNREKEEVEITTDQTIPIEALQKSLPSKYRISEIEKITDSASSFTESQPSKIQQLKPLFIIIAYILAASILLHYKDWNYTNMMYDFMGLFFLVFSFFKILDIRGFKVTFQMYDPIAKRIPLYGAIYPIIETILALMFLFRWNLKLAAIITIVILGFTTFGVVKVLMDKKSIKCACLGTALNLPMTEATFIENALMIVMAVIMLFQI